MNCVLLKQRNSGGYFVVDLVLPKSYKMDMFAFVLHHLYHQMDIRHLALWIYVIACWYVLCLMNVNKWIVQVTRISAIG